MVRFGHEIISTAMFSLLQIQVQQLSVTGESIGTSYWLMFLDTLVEYQQLELNAGIETQTIYLAWMENLFYKIIGCNLKYDGLHF